MSSQLEQLKAYTTVVADTGDFKQIAAFAPRDATTNPSLILKAVSQPAYAPLLAQTAAAHRGQPLDAIVDRVLVRFGCEILNVVPGRVSTEVDARLSFDAAATVARAQRIMALYESEGIARDRVLIKIAATWEGIQAAKALEHHGIHCNLTLLFAFCQAVACGESGVRLISPFVGRIHDWHKKAAGARWDEAANAGANDPGVKSVAQIWRYFRKFGIETEVMGASFRNTGQILALAGCDLLTISPELLAQLQASEATVARALDVDAALHCDAKALSFNEASFRYALNEDAMATEKLAEGIRAFAVDAAQLDRLIQALVMSASWVRGDRTAAWADLSAHFAASAANFDLRTAFAGDAQRFERFGVEAPHLFADLSKNWLDAAALALLLRLAREVGLEGRRDAMFAGAPLNNTEGRAVLHTALRAPRDAAPHGSEVHATLDAMLAFAERMRDTAHSGITDVVNIGIGGSDLGPQMVVPALQAYTQAGLRSYFVSNLDGHDLAPLLTQLDPQRTLFIVASKTFTTQETMANAETAKAWFLARGGRDIARHFVATTTNVDAAVAFGIDTTFGFWDWVGGRYSLWSAIGLPVAIALGATHFRALLGGAHAMDRHFATAPLERNLPVLLGLLDVWYRNFHGLASRSVAPYHQGLRRLPAYLQQLEMESNGKRVDRDGEPLPFATSPVVWGEPGTNAQHAYFQMLHQGSDVIPVEFIAVRDTSHAHLDLPPALQPLLAEQQRKLLANCLAQAQALMTGKSEAQALAERAPTAAADMPRDVLARHRSFPGNRPSTTLLLERLDPAALGALIAMYEHRVFTSGVVWGINSFDQWGVELGKAMCNELLPRLDSGDASGLDASTAGLLRKLRA